MASPSLQPFVVTCCNHSFFESMASDWYEFSPRFWEVFPAERSPWLVSGRWLSAGRKPHQAVDTLWGLWLGWDSKTHAQLENCLAMFLKISKMSKQCNSQGVVPSLFSQCALGMNHHELQFITCFAPKCFLWSRLEWKCYKLFTGPIPHGRGWLVRRADGGLEAKCPRAWLLPWHPREPAPSSNYREQARPREIHLQRFRHAGETWWFAE